jgi:ubiquinone/menaquinone biosynthesis C-methylase UbiE
LFPHFKIESATKADNPLRKRGLVAFFLNRPEFLYRKDPKPPAMAQLYCGDETLLDTTTDVSIPIFVGKPGVAFFAWPGGETGGPMKDRMDFFDRHASSWDETYEHRTAKMAEVVTWFQLREGDTLLDVGTGTGILLPFLGQAIGETGRLAAMDFSYKMLDRAKGRPCLGVRALINASVEWIPFQSGRFDCVTCFSAFPHFPNKRQALGEMVRVLKRGGSLFIAHLHSREEINQFHRQVGDAVVHDHLPPPEALQRLMTDSGLSDISVINEPGKFLARGKKH